LSIINEIEWSWRKVSPDTIHSDPRFQPRVKGVSDALVNKYAWDMRRGDTFPPILVGRVANVLYVLDGFHRLEAARAAGLSEISIRVASMREDTAVWVAVEANAIHGLNLTRSDKRHCFQRYCETGRHVGPDGSIKSLREMRRELHNIAHPSTLSKWLKSVGIVPSDDPEGPVKEWDRDEELQGPDLDEFDVQLHALESVFHGLGDDDRIQAARRISALANRIVEVEKDSPAFLDI
jgi:hypothetical protein